MFLKNILKWASKELKENKVSESQKSAEFLLRQVLEWDKARLLANPNYELNEKEEKKFRKYIERRKKHEPVWYITGRIEFYGLDLEVNENVLIPRPETEFLVEEVLKCIPLSSRAKESPPLSSRAKRSEVEGSLRKKSEALNPCLAGRQAKFETNSEIQNLKNQNELNFRLHGNDNIRILELGTGSGAIALALASEFKKEKGRFWSGQNDVKLFASDISVEALKVARGNAKRLGLVEAVEFRQGDLFEPWNNQRFDIIVANLPYIPHEEMASLALDIHHWEPRTALDGGKEGLEIYERLLAQAGDYLNEDAMMFFEIGIGQGVKIKKLVKKYFPKARVEIKKDYAGIDRIAIIKVL